MYVGIPVRRDFKAYVDIRQIRALLLLLKKNVKIFYLVFDRKEKFAIQLRFLNSGIADTRANRCKRNINIYNLKVCSGSNCISPSNGIVKGSKAYADPLHMDLPHYRRLPDDFLSRALNESKPEEQIKFVEVNDDFDRDIDY